MRTCLLVDDSDVIRKIARRILESLHYNVIEAENGPQALERCQRAIPELILVDWHMPEMSGIDFISALKSVLGTDRPAIVYCTTEIDPEDITRAFHAGATDYLLKPYDREAITTKLRQLGLLSLEMI